MGRASLSDRAGQELPALGEFAWQRISEMPFKSVNGGRTTVGYRPALATEQIDAIDKILCAELGLGAAFATELKSYQEALSRAAASAQTTAVGAPISAIREDPRV